MIVDTHVHVTSLDEKTHPKVKDAYDWPTFPVEEYVKVMDAVGIDRATLVQPYFTYHFDNRYQADATKTYRKRFLWGSNYPAHWNKYGKVPERLALSQQDMAFLPKEDRRWIFGESALAVWPALR